MHRRDFLLASLGAATSVATLSTRAYAAVDEKPLRAALIGCGWYGKTDLFHLMQVAPIEVVGLCDVDSRASQTAAELTAQRQPNGKLPPTFTDYRKLLAAQQPEIVLVATPDHWHCLPMIAACEAGADVYVQKPISFDVVEGQAMVTAARSRNRTVQVGLQRRNTPHLLEARDRFIRGGKLGRIGSVDIHSYFGQPREFPAPSAPPPELDWETYVGPASWRPYNAGIHPKRWRDCPEFSNGQIGDLCVHFFDLVRYFLELGWPRRISASGGVSMRRADSQMKLPDTQTAIFEFDRVQVVWNQRNWGQNPDPKYPWGATLYGEYGTLKLSVQSYDYVPLGEGEAVHGEWVDERAAYPADEQHKETELFAAPATRRHMRDFLAARRENRLPVSDIEEGHISSASCLLANLSMRLGRSLVWDAAAGKVADDEEANALLARPYRGDWVHPT